MLVAEHFHDYRPRLPRLARRDELCGLLAARLDLAARRPRSSRTSACRSAMPRLGGEASAATMRAFRAGVPWQFVLHSWPILDSHDSARFRTIAGSREPAARRCRTADDQPRSSDGVRRRRARARGRVGRGRAADDAVGRARYWTTLFDEYRRLIALRRSHEALARGGLRFAYVDDDVIAYLRETRDRAASLPREPRRRTLRSVSPLGRESSRRCTATTRSVDGRRRSASRSRALHSTSGGSTMADVVFDKVDKVFDNGVQAVHDLSLEIGDGEFVVLVGPSGCGKTTALRMVAGLEDITDGTISIGGRVVNDLTPKERDIAMVFQNYALYPAPLRVRTTSASACGCGNTPKDVVERAGRVGGELPRADAVPPPPAKGAVRRPAPTRRDGPRDRAQAAGLPHGRAAVEPRRQAACADARRDRPHPAGDGRDDDLRHARPGRGDDDGRSRRGDAQGRAPADGEPQRLYDTPKNLFVASFIGSPAMNIVEANDRSGRDGGIAARSATRSSRSRRSSRRDTQRCRATSGRTLALGIRPEHLEDAEVARNGGARLHGRVLLTEALGSEILAHVEMQRETGRHRRRHRGRGRGCGRAEMAADLMVEARTETTFVVAARSPLPREAPHRRRARRRYRRSFSSSISRRVTRSKSRGLTVAELSPGPAACSATGRCSRPCRRARARRGSVLAAASTAARTSASCSSESSSTDPVGAARSSYRHQRAAHAQSCDIELSDLVHGARAGVVAARARPWRRRAARRALPSAARRHRGRTGRQCRRKSRRLLPPRRRPRDRRDRRRGVLDRLGDNGGRFHRPVPRRCGDSARFRRFLARGGARLDAALQQDFDELVSSRRRHDCGPARALPSRRSTARSERSTGVRCSRSSC